MTDTASRSEAVRLAVLGLYHEANTFSGVLAELDDYRTSGWHTGTEMVAHYWDSHSVVGGFLEADSGEGEVELIPLPVGFVTPCGPIAAEAHQTLIDELIAALAAAGEVDAVLLVLHGAAVAENDLHVDATIAERVRAQVGPEVPIGTVLDMHANVEQRLIDAVDLTLAYQTNPHVDAREVGAECRRLVLEMVRTGRRPATVLEHVPVIVTIVNQDTSQEPIAGLLRLAREIEAEPGMVDVSLLEGFPYADVPQMGMSVIATHPDPDVARHAAKRLARAVWETRHDLQGEGIDIATAVDMVKNHEGVKPLLLLDVGDNVGGGGPGDSTSILERVLAEGVAGSATTLFDPAAVRSLAEVPMGERVNILAGGRSQEQEGLPVRLVGTITGRHIGVYEEPGIAHGGFRFFDGGEMVGVRTDKGVHIVLTSLSVQPISPEQYRVVGIEPGELVAIIAKGVNGPRAGFAETCGEIVVVDSPGVTRNSVTDFTYSRRRVPMFPYELDTAYP